MTRTRQAAGVNGEPHRVAGIRFYQHDGEMG